MNIFEDVVKKNKNYLQKFDGVFKEVEEECDNFLKEINNFLETGNADFFKKLSVGKENADSAIVSTNKRKGRAKKPALADITETNVLTNTFKIKKEKISDIQDVSKNSESLKDMVVEIKREVEEMPAPTKLPPRKKKIKTEALEPPLRSTRTRTRAKKQDGNDTSSDKEEVRSVKTGSDIMIQNTSITTIEISDTEKDTETESDTEKSKNQNNLVVRSTRSKIKKRTKSDVIYDQTKNYLKVEVTNEKLEPKDLTKIRSTRTRTIQKKRNRSNSTEELNSQTEKKKSRSNSAKEQEYNGSVQTEYEDAVSMMGNNEEINGNADATYIASSKDTHLHNGIANSTIIVENPKVAVKDQRQIGKDMLGNETKPVETTPSKHANKGKGTKQMFSPFDKTPLKKKVEAFEKLRVEASSIPTRLTRTKKKAQKKDSNGKDDCEMRSIEDEDRTGTTEKERPKVFTPIAPKFMPKVCSTSKISKLHPSYSDMSTNNESILSVKSASALKASQAEFREREKRRQEKEREALKKREALLQAQTEEKRRKREEKQHKAQQQREMLEKEKLKQLEVQRIKEEKYKQVIAEREEKLQKQKEEADKKRLMAKKKANELLKEKEEAVRIAEQKKYAEMKGEMAKIAMKQKMERAHQQQPLPVYMTTKAPLMPTDDCYDSDEPEFERKRNYEPLWSKERDIREMQMIMIAVGETIKNTLFCRQVQTPDLQEIFEIIDPRKLKRTSSAIWRKPPRYTLMPAIADQPEFSEDSD